MAFIRNPKDFWAGLLFIGLGIAAIAVGSNYNLGTAARMGPGYFPRILGILLLCLGAIIAARGLRASRRTRAAVEMAADAGRAVSAWSAFGLIMAKVGMAISTVLLILVASAASHEFRPKEALVAGVLLAALSVGVFIVALHVQLPIWPEFSR